MAKFLSPQQIQTIEGEYRRKWGPIRVEMEQQEVERWHPWEIPPQDQPQENASPESPPRRPIQVIRMTGPSGWSVDWEIVDAKARWMEDDTSLAHLAHVIAHLPAERVIIDGNFIGLYFRRELTPREAFFLASHLEEAVKPFRLHPSSSWLETIPEPLDWVILWMA